MRLTNTKAREILTNQTGVIELRHPDGDGQQRSVSVADAIQRIQAGYVMAFGTREHVNVLMIKPQGRIFASAADSRAEFNTTTVRHGIDYEHRKMQRQGLAGGYTSHIELLSGRANTL